MTREEALTRDGTLPYSRENLINQIFDEHEEELKQAYTDGSNSCNELIQSQHKLIEAKDEEIGLWKAEFRRMQDIAINKDVALEKALEEIKELKDEQC